MTVELRPEDVGIGRLFWAIREAVVVVDAATGRIALWNPAAEALFGYPAAEALGLDVAALVPARLRARHRAGLAGYRATGRGRLIDAGVPAALPAVRRDGTEVPIELTLTPLDAAGGRYVLALIRDLTERRRAEETVRAVADRAAERLARLQAVAAALAGAATREAVAEAALREGRAAVGAVAGGLGVLTDGGRGLERLAMLGYPPEIAEATRHVPLDDLGPIADTARTDAAIWLETNEELFSRYPQLAAIPARRRYGAAVSVPLAVGGRVLGVLSLRFAEERGFDREDRDLIVAIADQCAQALERARLFEAARAAREEAEAAVRARDVFLSIAAHELKTPVTAVKATAQLLLHRQERDALAPERLARGLGGIDQATDRLARLVEDLLDVSRIRTGQLPLALAPVDLPALVADAVARARDHDGDAHRFAVEAPDGLAPVLADAGRLDQVLTNLLDNAAKYSLARGDIAVVVRAEDGGVVVAVRDQGLGLPAGVAETIFAPFGRASNAERAQVPGMGLGLYICRSIVERHGGRIWAESAGEGRGTTVVFQLPTGSPTGDGDMVARRPSG